MSSDDQPPRNHMPMSRVAICLDCESVFWMDKTCPACGSKQWVALTNWIRPHRLARREADAKG